MGDVLCESTKGLSKMPDCPPRRPCRGLGRRAGRLLVHVHRARHLLRACHHVHPHDLPHDDASRLYPFMGTVETVRLTSGSGEGG